MSSLSAVTGNQTQGNSCLYSHIIDWLQSFQTLAFFSLQCIPYHYPHKRPLYTWLSWLLSPALLDKVIWKIIPKWLRILQGSSLKHHSVFLKIFMPLQTKQNKTKSQSLYLKLDSFVWTENHKLSKKYLFIQTYGFAFHQNTSDSCKDDSNLWYLLCITLVAVLLFLETQKVPPEKSNHSVLIRSFWRQTSIGMYNSHTLNTNSESRKPFSACPSDERFQT